MGKKKKHTLEIQEINEVFSDMVLEEEQMEKIYEYLEAQNVDVLRITGGDIDDDVADDVEILLSDEDDVDVEKIDLSASVRYIGKAAFTGCHKIESFHIGENIEYLGSEFISSKKLKQLTELKLNL